jgi:PKD repeat protein
MQSRLRAVRYLLPVLALAAAAACTKQAESFQPSGPSELGLSLTLQATPDVLPMDGVSQAQISIQTRGPNGEAQRNVACRVEIVVDGVIADIGRLSSKSVVTGSDGRATVSYTAPAGPPEGNSDSLSQVQILVSPVGYDFANTVFRNVNIRLVPQGVVLPPNGTPVADFSYSPLTPREGDVVGFDGSLSKDDGQFLTYEWDFGDGFGGSGVRTSHVFGLRGSYLVTLKVTDDRGLSAQTSKTVAVSASEKPTAIFNVSPTPAKAGESVFFNAAASVAAPGRQLVRFDWAFGDGTFGTGFATAHIYPSPGAYTVTLSVTDSAGQVGTTSSSVTVQ